MLLKFDAELCDVYDAYKCLQRPSLLPAVSTHICEALHFFRQACSEEHICLAQRFAESQISRQTPRAP